MTGPVTNDEGSVVSQMEYLPYGETWFQDGDEKYAPKYNSQELDKESGYYFYNARYYDPAISRFIIADNVIDGEYSTQGWNRYAYVHNNPVRYLDPTGHDALDRGIQQTLDTVNEVIDYNDQYHTQKTQESIAKKDLLGYMYHSSSALVSKAAKFVTPKNKTDLDQIAIASTLIQGYKGVLGVQEGISKIIDKATTGSTRLVTNKKGITNLIDTKTGRFVEQNVDNLKSISPIQKVENSIGSVLSNKEVQKTSEYGKGIIQRISPESPVRFGSREEAIGYGASWGAQKIYKELKNTYEDKTD